jgi:hypothetical protein
MSSKKEEKFENWIRRPRFDNGEMTKLKFEIYRYA